MTVLPLLAALSLTAGPISLQFEGPLDEALKQIASQGGLNVVVASGTDEHVQVNLSDVSAEEALESLSHVYGLSLTRQGKLWVIRPRHAAAVAAVPPVPPVPQVHPPVRASGDDDDDEAEDGEGGEASEDEEDVAEAARDAAQRIRDEAEEARERAEEMKERAEELAEARREQMEAMREVVAAKAELARHRVATGGPVRVEANTTVETAVAYGGPVVIEPNAVVEGDAVAFGGDVVLEENAVVEGDAVAFAGTVVKGANAVVKGESVSMGGSGLGSVISKSVVKSGKFRRDGEVLSRTSGSSAGNRLAAFLIQFAMLFGLGFALMMFAPQRMRAVEAAIRAEPVRNGLAGLFGLIAAFPLTILLLVTVVGIPVAVLLWVALLLFVPVGLAAVANTIGSLIPTGRLRRTQALVLAVGVLVLRTLWEVPGVGVLIAMAAIFVSLGAIIRTRFGQPGRGTPIFESPRTAPAL